MKLADIPRFTNDTPTLLRVELVFDPKADQCQLVTHPADGNGVPVWPGCRLDAQAFAALARAS